MNPQILPGRVGLINFNADSRPITVEHFHPDHFQFSQSDTEKNFKKKLESESEDWYYRNNPIKYTLNGQNYRCKPFTKINWSKSIVIFGCSNTFGDGVDDGDTISARLQELTGCDVINLGAPGSSQQFSLYNMLMLKKRKIKPKAIIHIWTDSMRLFYINNDFRHCYVGHWNNFGLSSDVKFNPFDDSKTHIVSSMYNRMTANLVYSDIPVIHATHFQTMWEEQESIYPDYPMTYLPHIDKARDLLHPGREGNIVSAKLLHEELLKYGATGETRTLNP